MGLNQSCIFCLKDHSTLAELKEHSATCPKHPLQSSILSQSLVIEEKDFYLASAQAATDLETMRRRVDKAISLRSSSDMGKRVVEKLEKFGEQVENGNTLTGKCLDCGTPFRITDSPIKVKETAIFQTILRIIGGQEGV